MGESGIVWSLRAFVLETVRLIDKTAFTLFSILYAQIQEKL